MHEIIKNISKNILTESFFPKSLGKTSSFIQIYGILIDFPDLTLYLDNKFLANYASDTLRYIKWTPHWVHKSCMTLTFEHVT